MTDPRVILHLDLDAFFCAVEEIKDPGLRGKAFAVGGSPTGRGVVTSCSYPARKMGVRSAMPAAKALQLCPNLILVSRNHRDYGRYSKLVMDRLRSYTDQLEQISIDEAFLDITGLGSGPRELGQKIQSAILNEIKLPNSVGIASNKLVAKIATDVGKIAFTGEGPPNAITVVPTGEERSFLAPLPVQMLSGVGPKTRERLERFNIQTIGDLADYSEVDLANKLGKHGYDLSRRAKGIDERGIVTERGVKSVSNERTFPKDLGRKTELREYLNRLSHQVSNRLQKKNLRGKTVQIKLRWSDFTTLTRQTTLSQTTNDFETIYESSLKLLDQVWEEGRQVRLIGVGVHNLDTHAHQLGLWDTGVQKDLKLQETMRDLHQAINDVVARRGIALIPAFAIGRTTVVLYRLEQLERAGAIPEIPIYVDSPMAISANEVYCNFGDDPNLAADLRTDSADFCPLRDDNTQYVRSTEGSKRLNALRGPAIIVSASGMLTGGRVIHHLKRLLPEERNKILLVGYQAAGTRGWRLRQGEKQIKMHGQMVPVRAEVVNIRGFSAHGDEADLLDWLSTAARPPRQTFLVHGESESLAAMETAVRDRLGWPTAIPEYMSSVELE